MISTFSRIASCCVASLLVITQASAECPPVISGAIINVAAECFNDNSALIVDQNSTDANGWQYTEDSAQDGVDGHTVGNTAYEIYGMAFSERYFSAAGSDADAYQLCLVINSNLPLTGKAHGTAADGNIGWGDVLMNFGSANIITASDNRELFGVRFSATNDSSAPQPGTYNSVKASSVTSQNAGFTSWGQYSNFVTGKSKIPTMGDLGSDPTSYFPASISYNVISIGDLVSSDITFLSNEQLQTFGYDTDRWPGTDIGFCWRKWDWIDPCGVIGGDGSFCTHCGVLCGPGGTDSDNDGTKDCADDCQQDPRKVTAGQCGCGVMDTDSDHDGTADCNDACDDDGNKTSPGVCGCGIADIDSDSDQTFDCNDGCPSDPDKAAPGVCGCGITDIDSDNDGIEDCNDNCPSDSSKTDAGICGCGIADTDSDLDGTADCLDECPLDADKIQPGQCSCGVSEHFCAPETFASCGDGQLHQSEQCDDGNTQTGDGCVACRFESDILADATCETSDTSDLQRTLDGLAKKLERRGRKHARLVQALLQARNKRSGRWMKTTFEALHTNQLAAWTAIWIPSSKHITCNEEGHLFCTVVKNEKALTTYSEGLKNLLHLSHDIKRKLRREARRAENARMLRIARRYNRILKRFERRAVSGLKQMPLTNLHCSDAVL